MAAVDDIRTLTEKFVAALNEGDPGPFVAALDDDLEVFDHAAYRFDDKPSFLAYLQASMRMGVARLSSVTARGGSSPSARTNSCRWEQQGHHAARPGAQEMRPLPIGRPGRAGIAGPGHDALQAVMGDIRGGGHRPSAW